jgi:hypothetical protein
MLIEIPESYVTEHLSNGFSLYAGRDVLVELVRKSVALGHRLATEGKDLVLVDVVQNHSPERMQPEVLVRVKIRHRLRTSVEAK